MAPIDRHAELHGLYAILPTPARPGANRWDARDTVDLDETARLVDQLIVDGSSGLIALGTTGECPTLTAREYAALARCVVDAAAHRVPVYVGATALGTHEVVERLEVLADVGADGTLLGLPMWQPLTTEMAVAYFADVAAAYPQLSVMVYANERAFRFPFRTATDFWAQVIDAAPTVNAAKFSRGDTLPTLREATRGRVNFLPSDMVAATFAEHGPGVTACWATAASMGPEPCLAMIDAITTADANAVAAVTADIGWANEPIGAILADQTVFASYNIQIEKARIAEAGYCVPGPVRPPYSPLPPDYREAARECGRRWCDLRAKYATQNRSRSAS